MKWFVGAALCTVSLVGCSTFQVRQASWPWKGEANLCQQDDCNTREAMKRFHEAVMFCRSVHNYYESGGMASSKVKLAVGAFGTLAGSVAAPLAAGSAATAWSSLSGATNALQTSINDNFSPTVSINRMTEVRTATEQGEADYTAATDENAKVLAAVKMAAMCAMAPGQADKAAMRALLGE